MSGTMFGVFLRAREMVRAKKAAWLSHGRTVSYTLAFVFLFYAIVEIIVDSRFSSRMTESELQAYESRAPVSLTSENLAGATESLRLNLRVEARDFPTEELTKTKAWSELQDTLSQYARGLEYLKAEYELLEEQNKRLEAQNELWGWQDSKKRRVWLSYLLLPSVIGMVVFGELARRSRKMDSTN